MKSKRHHPIIKAIKSFINPRIFVLIAVLLGGMGQGVVAPKLPELLAASQSLLVVSSGISATLMYFGIFISTYRYGRLADRGNVHWLLGLGLIAYCVTLLALGLLKAPVCIFSVRFFEGLAISAVYVAADFVLGRLSEAKERGQWLSYYGVALSVGLILGPALALGSFTLGRAAGLSEHLSSTPLLPLGLVAALALLASIPGFQVRVAALKETQASPAASRLGPLFSGAVYGFMEAALVAVFPVLAVREFQVPPEYCLLAVILSAAVSSIAWGYLSDRLGPRRIVTWLLGFLSFGTAFLGLARPALSPGLAAYSSCIFFGVVAGGLYPVGFAWLLEGVPEAQYGFASGSFARAYGLGSLFGPLLVGVGAQYFGSRGLYFGVLAAAASGLGATRFSKKSLS